MAQLLPPDRVLETSTTTGTGSYTLLGAVTGYRAVSAVASNNDTVYYYAEDVGMNGTPLGSWETGLGTYKTGNILERSIIYASSNSNAAVNWSTGTRRIGLSANNALFADIQTKSNLASTSAINSAISETNANNSAVAAALSAASAASSTGAALWVSGTSYSVGALVYSPADRRNYRRKVAGTGTTDPSLDSTNWSPVLLEAITGRPSIKPSLLLDFSNSSYIDPIIEFARASKATYFNDKGVLTLVNESVPRIDYNPISGECLGLLMEESKTNLLLYSEQFDNATWTSELNPATVTTNNSIAPDGTNTADLIDDISASAAQLVRQPVTIPNDSASYTFSVFVERNTSRYVALWLSFQGGITRESFWTYDLDSVVSQAGDSPATSGSITDVGNGWRRLTITHANTSEGNVTLICRIYPAIAALGSVDPTATGSIWVWGAQLETSEYVTSYIPTTTVAVTRATDVAQITGTNFSKWYRQDEGSFITSASMPGFVPSGGSTNIVSISDGTTNNVIRLRVIKASSGADLYVVAGGVIEVDTSDQTIGGLNTRFISSIGYKVNDFAVSTIGSAVQADASGNTPTVSQLVLCSTGSARVNKFVYYPKRLTNAELVTLSTP